MKCLKSLALLSGLMLILWPSVASAQTYRSQGYDASWPNCQKLIPRSDWGIVGVTGGLDFTRNLCAFNESTNFTSYALYMNSGYPGLDRALKYQSSPKQCSATNENCLAYNYGYAAAIYALNYAASQNLHTNYWWVDVESVNSWSNDPNLNRAAIGGMVDGIKKQTLLSTIGIYSYPGQWNLLTNNWHIGLPAWSATGLTNLRDALSYCYLPSFTAANTWLVQYTTNIDVNYVCLPNLTKFNNR